MNKNLKKFKNINQEAQKIKEDELDSKMTELLKHADQAMYKAKKMGKNPSARKSLQGVSISPGIGMGKALIYKDILSRNLFTGNIPKENVNKEIKRINEIKKHVINDLNATRDIVEKDISKGHAEIFEAHKVILEDEQIVKDIESIVIRDLVNAEQAVKRVFFKWADKFKSSDNKNLQSKAADMLDVGRRMIRGLLGYEHNILDRLPKNTIVVAKRLLPSDTVNIDEKNISGLVLEQGNRHSHSAIIAKAMGLPAISKIKEIDSKIKEGDEIILLGEENKVIVNPNKNDKQKYESIRKKEKQYKVSKKPIIMKNGEAIKVYANVATESEVNKALKNGCDGIGLFRTERIYMALDNLPDEKYLIKEMDKILDHAKNKEITIRLLDIGSDKNLPYIDIEDYMDPSLGIRGVRTLLKYDELLKVQLKALVLLSKKYLFRILVPMITLPSEIDEIKKYLKNTIKQLTKENGDEYSNIPVGAMIETPAAVMGIKEISKKADFLSIGTNDLIQYTMASGRENNELTEYFDKGPEIIMESLANVVNVAKGLGIDCGICGEIAGDEKWIKSLLDIGIREFSVSPGSISFLKKEISGWIFT
ncbi:MAG: phosphoenolpyruvate--protein phosphotransferase [Candidatus Omnitrophica bacterium]|nr:phosphoenolpyruvate--protein phosphotransferase [Candidatus Omnitrophota bacterium]